MFAFVPPRVTKSFIIANIHIATRETLNEMFLHDETTYWYFVRQYLGKDKNRINGRDHRDASNGSRCAERYGKSN